MASLNRKLGPILAIEIRGIRDAQGRFARAEGELLRARRDELRDLGRRTVSALRDAAPNREGELAKGLRFHTTERGGVMELRVTSAAKHTGYVIRGRGPVVAIHAKALRFEPGPPGSGFIFRKRVGPAKANPFHRPVISRMGGEIARTAERIGRRVERAFSLS